MAENRLVIFTKDERVAVLALQLGEVNNRVAFMTDKNVSKFIAHRLNPPAYFEFHADALKAIERYTRSRSHSIKHGWQIGFIGQPNFG